MIQFTSIVQNANKSWTFYWAPVAGALQYRIVLWGLLQAVTQNLFWTWKGQEYTTQPPPLEAVPFGQLALSEQFSPIMTFQWYQEVCSQYFVEQGGGTVKTFQEQNRWVYTYSSPVLQDESTYVYTVIAQDSLGNQSAPRTYSQYIVCPPVPPAQENSYTPMIILPPPPPPTPPPTRQPSQIIPTMWWDDYDVNWGK